MKEQIKFNWEAISPGTDIQKTIQGLAVGSLGG